MKRLSLLIILICAFVANTLAQVTVPFNVPTPTWEMLITLKDGCSTPVFQKANASSNVLQSQCGEECHSQWGSDSYTPEFWDKLILSDYAILPLISQGNGWAQFEFIPEIIGWAQAHNFRKVQTFKLTKADIEASNYMLAWEQDSDLYVIAEGVGGPGYSEFWLGKLINGYVVCPYVCYLDMDPDSNHPGILNGVVSPAGLSKFTRRDVDYLLANAGKSGEDCLVAFGYIGKDGNKAGDSLLTGMVSARQVVDKTEEDNTIYERVETDPAFPGGLGALMSHIAKNQRYPLLAQEKREQGKVVVSFVIEKDGSVGEVNLVQKVSPALDNEAIRVVKTLPKFTPGKINGRVVRSKMSLPITFRLK